MRRTGSAFSDSLGRPPAHGGSRELLERELVELRQTLVGTGTTETLMIASAPGAPPTAVKMLTPFRARSTFLDAADPFIADFFVAMIETGCRPGELRTLQWSEVRPHYIVVLAEKAKDRQERNVPIMPTLQAILDRRRIGPDSTDLAETAHVFGNEVGEMLTPRSPVQAVAGDLHARQGEEPASARPARRSGVTAAPKRASHPRGQGCARAFEY